MKLLSLFSGIGAFEKALEKLGIEFELVNYCEIDKYASKAYALIHGISEDNNLEDIKKVDTSKLPSDIDMITYGFPCQDFSISGFQRGFVHEGKQTRSGLFFEALRIIQDTKPKYAIAENVKNLTSKRFEKEFNTVLSSLDNAGYNNYWKVLNSKDYGIPQNRERVFIISIRKDIDDGKFEFPQPQLLQNRLKDMLEESVDKKYFMSEKAIAYICSTGTKNFSYKPKIDLEIARPLTSTMHKSHRASEDNYVSDLFQKEDIKLKIEDGKLKVPEEHKKLYVRVANSKGYDEAKKGDSINFEQPSSTTRRGRVGKQVAQTINTLPQQGVVIDETLRIRKLTPKECFRLMGFDDRDIDVCIENGISNTQLYKMAGNSIVVNVLEGIFKNLLRE